MFVYLMRHGLAEDRAGIDESLDAHRPMSENGIHRMRVQAAAFRRMVGVLDEIWTSPITRARHTAAIVSTAQEPTLLVREVAALAREGELDAVLDRFRKSDDALRVLLVGHELGLTHLASHMLTGLELPMVKFQCGAVCCFEMIALDPIVRAQLRWFLAPHQLRALM